MIEPNRPQNRPAPEDLASVMSRVDAMLSRLESGIPSATRSAGSRPSSPASVATPATGRPRPTPDFSFEGFEDIASPAPRPLPRPVPAGPTVDYLATPRASFESATLVPKPDARRWLWTLVAIGVSAVAVASWWSALQHVANDGVRPLAAEELKALVR